MPAWFYILRLRSGRLYLGATSSLDSRWERHVAGRGCQTTKADPPVQLAYAEKHPDFSAARDREVQVKRWTHSKKESLIAGDLRRLHLLAKRRKR
ncbi:MAG: GIY-YIG nuclease family protein [Candidatus Brocadiia bacterium]